MLKRRIIWPLCYSNVKDRLSLKQGANFSLDQSSVGKMSRDGAVFGRRRTREGFLPTANLIFWLNSGSAVPRLLFVAVILDVHLGCLRCVKGGMMRMSVCQLCVVSGRLVVATFIVLCGLAMMRCCVLVVLGCFGVMLCCFC